MSVATLWFHARSKVLSSEQGTPSGVGAGLLAGRTQPQEHVRSAENALEINVDFPRSMLI
jgi:hypothetical protein